MKFVFLFSAMLVFLLFAAVGAFALTLAGKGKPLSVIVLGADATEPEKNAAAELADYVEKISGVRLETQAEPSADMANILVGQTEAAKEALPGFDWDSLKSDGVVIKTVPGGLVLAGDRPRGTLYAVYEFLERYQGVRFLTMDAEIVPRRDSVSLPDGAEYIHTPPLFSREVYYEPNHKDFRLAVKLRLNGHYNSAIPEEWGGRCELIGFAHTFEGMLLPAGRYFAEHPEWYAERGGHRVPTQPCLSDLEVLDKLAENVLAELDKRKDPMMISVTQNDNDAPCQCEKCQAMVKEFGAESGMLINALNYISDIVREKYPDVMLETFAYQYTVPVPTNITPRDNVIVRICDIENNFGEPIREKSGNGPYKVMENCRIFGYADQQTVNGDYYKNLEAWSKIAKNLFIWNYTVNFNNSYIIHPNFHCLKPDVETFVRHRASAIFEQGDTFNRSVAFNVVKQYLMAHLLWDPGIDDDAVIRDFMRNYYGDAWEDLYKLICFCEKIIKDKRIFLSTYMNDVSWMSADEMTECFRLFTSALSKVSGRKEYRDRVYNELLFFQTGWYLADEETRKKVAESGWLQITDPDRFAKELYRYAMATDNGRYSEGMPLNATRFAPYIPLVKSGNVPPECRDLPDEDWLEIPAGQMDVTADNGWAEHRRDKKALGGIAAVLNTNSVQWAVKRALGREIEEKQIAGYTKMRIYGVVRTNGKKPEADGKTALHTLIWDSGYRLNNELKGRELSDEYATVELGECSTEGLQNPGLYFFTHPDKDLGDGVYFDRVFIIFEK
ncbi:MAG: DUF4838 domain-containing protein [Abditibacteriota bacterium]|nr:DUF4838 domain-containing protein [Abditibacteriota bacterium]